MFYSYILYPLIIALDQIDYRAPSSKFISYFSFPYNIYSVLILVMHHKLPIGP